MVDIYQAASWQAHKLEIKHFHFNFVTFRMSMVIFTFPHRSTIYLAHQGKKKCLLTYNFQRICKVFSALHLGQQQQRSRPGETTCPLKDLVQGWLIPAFI